MRLRSLVIAAGLALAATAGIANANPTTPGGVNSCPVHYGMRATGETQVMFGYTLTSYDRFLVGGNCRQWPKGVYQCTVIFGQTVCAPKGTNFAKLLQSKLPCRTETYAGVTRQICFTPNFKSVAKARLR